MSRLAAIDIGTNTALLLIAEIRNQDEIYPLVQRERIVRLGEGVDKTKNFKKEAIKRTLEAVQDYLIIADEYNTRKVLISGTSAVRDAQNRYYFISRLKEEFDLELQILTGAEEARLTFAGALSNKHNIDGEVFLIDIGGGSTEYIVGAHKSIKKVISVDIGSVRLTERFVGRAPISNIEYNSIINCVNEHLINISKNWQFNPNHFVGVAGTVTTLAAMNLKMVNYDSNVVDNSILTIQQTANLVELLRIKSIAERKLILGLNPMRADVILAGGIILLETMKHFNFMKLIVSDRGLRFGLLIEFLSKNAV